MAPVLHTNERFKTTKAGFVSKVPAKLFCSPHPKLMWEHIDPYQICHLQKFLKRETEEKREGED